MNRVVLLLGILMTLNQRASGKEYALLVGVSSYAASDRFTLEGPRHDIAALRRVLVERFRIAPEQIRELIDQRATRANILSELGSFIDRLQANDSFLLYFSGHGTSAFDANFQPVAALIGPNSGALVPYDFDSSSPETMAKTLIIGRRDLRPALLRANRQATVLVILDSCYSGNSAKSIGEHWEGRIRAIHAVRDETAAARPSDSQRGTARSSGTVAGSTQSTAEAAFTPTTGEADDYPYANVIAFSAASKNEPARDIDSRVLRSGKFQTFDGLPHGAFSNSLLAALEGASDSNHDGTYTYGELFRYIRQNVQESHQQTPQLQIPSESMLNLPALSLRGGNVPPVASRTPETSTETRLAIEGASAAELDRLRMIPSVLITSGAHDLLVRRDPGFWSLYRQSHVLLRRYADDQFGELVRRIAAHVEVQRLERLEFSGQHFSLSLDARPVGRTNPAGMLFASRYAVGEEFSVVCNLERSSYLLLIGIDASGSVSVLLPSPKEVQPISAQRTFEVVRARATAPAGTELLRAFAFLTRPEGWENLSCQVKVGGLSCPQFDAGSRQYLLLLEMLQKAAPNGATATLRLETTE